jgi:excisionase family DNA binding protein
MQITLDEKTFFDIAELSKQTGIGPATLRQYVREGKLKAVKIGKSYWIEKANLKQIFETGLNKPVKRSKKDKKKATG